MAYATKSCFLAQLVAEKYGLRRKFLLPRKLGRKKYGLKKARSRVLSYKP
ncbi:hypothetical protein [Pseudolactococcus reticulitermitis]|nr:hypothetical protein [Lactococcus reticulitermitis]